MSIMSGAVYVLINPSIPNLVKIGKTTRSATERAAELSQATGVPTPFVVAYEAKFDDCHAAEKMVHDYLESLGHRKSSNREFFEISPSDGVDALIQVKKTLEKVSPSSSDDTTCTQTIDSDHELWEDVEDRGDDYRYGTDLILEDLKSAEAAYKSAAFLGSPTAHVKLSELYASQDRKRDCIEILYEGAKLDRNKCWLELALIFSGMNMFFDIEDEDRESALRCFRNFFLKVDPAQHQPSLDSLFAVLKSYILKLDGQLLDIDSQVLDSFLPKFAQAIAESNTPANASIKFEQIKALLTELT